MLSIRNFEFGRRCRKGIYIICDILSGHALTDEAKKKLLKSPNEIVTALLKIFDYFYPVPCTNIIRHPQYRISVFAHLAEDDEDFLEAQCLHIKQYTLMSTGEYLENLANRPNPNELIFRSNDTIRYLSISESRNLLMDWLIFQFGGNAGQFIELVYNWLHLNIYYISRLYPVGEKRIGAKGGKNELLNRY